MTTCFAAAVVFACVGVLARPAATQEIQCTIPAHTHTDECYTQVSSGAATVPVCSPESLEIHRHSPGCYDANGALVCGYADFVIHHHDAVCYDERGALWCPLSEVSAHQHDASCYALIPAAPSGTEPTGNVGATTAPDISSGDAPAGTDAGDSTSDAPTEAEDASIGDDIPATPGDRTDDCSASEAAFESGAETYAVVLCNSFTEEAAAPLTENADVPAQTVLICQRQEIIPHQHVAGCFDANGSWVCGRLQILTHQHTEQCFAEDGTQALTCTNTDEDHVHTQRCYGTWVLTCGMEEHAHTDACYASGSDPSAVGSDPVGVTESPASSEEQADPSSGMLKISLLYGDELAQESHPQGVSYYTHSTMSGYIKLEPWGLDLDLTDVKVTLSVPKKYVEKDSFMIPPFQTDSAVTKFEQLSLEEDDENYTVGILFTVYDKTQTLVLPFTLSFLDDIVPENYALPIVASVSRNGVRTETAPSIYKPQYNPWGIQKFVNSNRLAAFGEDGAEVVVTPEEEGGNPYLSDMTYVDFAFIVNGYTHIGNNLADFRDACEVTLTDELPKYTDKDGVSRIAVFDADQNPGWTLSSDGLTVSKTYQGENSGQVLLQIYNDVLRLRFPGLVFERLDEDLVRDLDNSVRLTAVPSGEAEGETRPSAEDSLRFRLTDDPSTAGTFSKWATKGDIYDLDIYKTNPYPWGISLSNDRAQPLRHIAIQDRKIVENGEVLVQGLDEALKFVRVESSMAYSSLPAGKTFADITEKITAFYTDGTTEDFPITQTDGSGNFTVVFNESKICDGYEIVLRDDYEMRYNEGVRFLAYTVYRDSENTHVPEGAEKITYTNTARSVNSYLLGNETVYAYLDGGHHYDMLPSTEKLSVSKQTLVNNDQGKLWGEGGDHVGDIFFYLIHLNGSLLESGVKEYEDIRIVDLLPDGVTYQKVYLIQQPSSVGPILDGGTAYQPEIVENYHNSGRTALIFHLNSENLREALKSPPTDIYFGVKIDADAHSGTVTNDVYVVGDNLDEYQGSTGGTADRFDLNNNGRTDDMVAWGSSEATIVAAQSIYAKKFIAPAGSDSWTEQGLYINAGAQFDYLLRVTNETNMQYTGLTIYDTLPRIGDTGIFGTVARGSEFQVQLREAITPPSGYTVFYTTDPAVYGSSMHDMVEANIWSSSVSDYSAVTAFKLVADETTVLGGKSSFQVRIPACACSVFSEGSLDILHGKEELDQDSGTVSYLESVNSFGFSTKELAAEKESNSVWARVPFAGFRVKKIDSVSGVGLADAEFTLADATGSIICTAVSDSQGNLQFRELTAGTYALTETKAPAGYSDNQLSVTVTITQNPATMEYRVSFGDASAGVGTSSDPLCIENHRPYMLPSTGGSGVGGLYALGVLSILLAFVLWLLKGSYHKKR